MGILTVKQESLKEIANAIRSKSEENSSLIFPDDFISAINNLGKGLKAPDNAIYQITEWSEDGFPASIKYKIPSDISDNSIPEYAFGNPNQNIVIYAKVKNVEISDKPTIAGNYSFQNCLSLNTISCYEDLTEIGMGAFQNTDLIYDHLPPKVVTIKTNAFNNVHFYFEEIPRTVQTIGGNAFYANSKISSIKFMGVPLSISSTSFRTSFLTDIYVPWAEGAIPNAPWGATNATIHYNTSYDSDGNPIEEGT